MARQKRVSVVADVPINSTHVVNDDTGEVVHFIEKYEIIPEGRLFRVRHWNGGAIPVELEGSFTSHEKIKQKLVDYFRRKGIAYDHRDHYDPTERAR